MFQLPYQEVRSIQPWGNSPSGAAMLKAAAYREEMDRFFDIEILPPAFVDRTGDAMLIDHLEAWKPDILCATLYLWNSPRSLYIAQQLKARLPDLLFVVGGPEVAECSSYIVENPHVDYGCIGEGEEVFTAILRSIAEGGEPPPLPGLFWRRDGGVSVTPGCAIVSDLSLLPSPLQMGILKPWNEAAVSYETMRGCPCSCSYCATGTFRWRSFPAARVVEDLALLHHYRVKNIRLTCCNFLLHPGFFDICSSLARINADKAMALACFGSAEHVTREKALALKSCNVCTVEIGLQTVNERTLQLIRRPPFNETRFLEGLKHLRDAGVDFSIDLIAGLPGETPRDIDRSIAFLKNNQVRCYTVFPLQLLPGSPLREEAAQHKIDADHSSPYTVIRTPTLSDLQIQSYAKMSRIDPTDILFDLAQEFVLPEFAAFNFSESAGTADRSGDIPVLKLLVGREVDIRRFAQVDVARIGGTVVTVFSNLHRSLSSFGDAVEAICRKNPFSVILPVFEIETEAEFDEVKRQCRRLSGNRLVRKTVVKDAALTIEGEASGDFVIFDRLRIDDAGDTAGIETGGAAGLFVDLSPRLSADDLSTVLTVLVGTGKKIQYRNLVFYYLDNLIRRQRQGERARIHSPVDMGRIDKIDARGGMVPHLVVDHCMALEIAHIQLLFMRCLPGEKELRQTPARAVTARTAAP